MKPGGRGAADAGWQTFRHRSSGRASQVQCGRWAASDSLRVYQTESKAWLPLAGRRRCPPQRDARLAAQGGLSRTGRSERWHGREFPNRLRFPQRQLPRSSIRPCENTVVSLELQACRSGAVLQPGWEDLSRNINWDAPLKRQEHCRDTEVHQKLTFAQKTRDILRQRHLEYPRIRNASENGCLTGPFGCRLWALAMRTPGPWSVGRWHLRIASASFPLPQTKAPHADS